ncbi:MAG: hypothetical protein JO102_06330, partial [Elusimicrobia bacterium]|nr:hypothetical protein [Elusimicrobiota bacterium]
FRALIARHSEEAFICVVAHMPEIGGFASSLVGDPSLVEQGLKPAEALCADCAVSGRGPEPGRLLWRRRVDEW